MRHTRSLRAVFLAVAGYGGLTAQTPPPADAQIRDTVRGELHRDTAVAAPLLDVEVRDGIVTLRGTSTNLLVAERAVAIARTVRGVRSVVDRITVEPLVPPTPLELRQAVDHALLLDPATDSYELTVTSHPGGRIELDGAVQSWAERELCARVAKSVDGVTELVNAITLAPPTRRPDAEIRQDVTQRLHWDLFVDDGLLEVHCDDGVVRLSGTVGSAAERARALQLAAVAGVERVLADDLDVARWARDDDLRGTKQRPRRLHAPRSARPPARQRTAPRSRFALVGSTTRGQRDRPVGASSTTVASQVGTFLHDQPRLRTLGHWVARAMPCGRDERTHRAGFDAHLVEPVDLPVILELLATPPPRRGRPVGD